MPENDAIGQGKRRLLAAAVRLAGGFARLPRLRRIDAIEPDALAVDLENFRGVLGLELSKIVNQTAKAKTKA